MMVENSENRATDEQADQAPGPTEDVIELSDITIGTTQEDEEIIELTEEVLDEAMGAVSSATGDSEEGEELDLSAAEQYGAAGDLWDSALIDESSDVAPQEPLDLDQEESEEVEEHISQELDNYFGEDEPAQYKPSAVGPETPSETAEPEPSHKELESTIERVIEEKFADRFEKMFTDIIDARLQESMEQLKQELLEASKK
ncbi:MAG TPA: hypothetical protein VKN73_02875 [Desulfosalsimonadaceae bacterium]|nr:hypothetical protein [Desulfosalsimonadaceae bacterium]